MDLGPDPNLMNSERCLHCESCEDHESRYRTRGVCIGRLSSSSSVCVHDSNGPLTTLAIHPNTIRKLPPPFHESKGTPSARGPPHLLHEKQVSQTKRFSCLIAGKTDSYRLYIVARIRAASRRHQASSILSALASGWPLAVGQAVITSPQLT